MSKKVSMENWKKLYTFADEIKNIAPWEFMTEMDVFVVESRAVLCRRLKSLSFCHRVFTWPMKNFMI